MATFAHVGAQVEHLELGYLGRDPLVNITPSAASKVKQLWCPVREPGSRSPALSLHQERAVHVGSQVQMPGIEPKGVHADREAVCMLGLIFVLVAGVQTAQLSDTSRPKVVQICVWPNLDHRPTA